jgi:large subunit ribosomal protein L25
MIQVNMSAVKRTAFGKSECRRLRMAKKTPAVIYGKGAPSLPLQFDEKTLYKNLLFIHRRNAVITLHIDGDEQESRHAMVQEIQKAPAEERVLHVDFLEIDVNKPVCLEVPLQVAGTAKGVEMGGDLTVSKSSVMLRGCPLDIPDEIIADVTPLAKGDSLACSALSVPNNVELLDNPATVCASVV